MTDQRQKVTNKIKNSHYSWNMIFFTLKKHLSSEAAHSQKKWKYYMNNNRPEETNLNISGTPWLPDKLCKHWFRLSEFWGLNCRHLNVSILWNATSSMTWGKTAVFAGCHVRWNDFIPNGKHSGDFYIFRTKRRTSFEGRRLPPVFQILLTRKCTLNILFYYSLNQKMITSNKLTLAFHSVPILVPWLILAPISSTSELELSVIGFSRYSASTWQGGDKRKWRLRAGWGWAIIWRR